MGWVHDCGFRSSGGTAGKPARVNSQHALRPKRYGSSDCGCSRMLPPVTIVADERTPGWVLHRDNWALHYGVWRPQPAVLCMATPFGRSLEATMSVWIQRLGERAAWVSGRDRSTDLSGALLSRELERWLVERVALIVARLGGWTQDREASRAASASGWLWTGTDAEVPPGAPCRLTPRCCEHQLPAPSPVIRRAVRAAPT